MTVGSATVVDDCRFRYTEGDLLGKGTYASVYAANDRKGQLGRVALKRIEFDHNVEGCPLLLLREVGLIKNLKHPNIVPIVDFIYSPTSGVAYIAFQLLECDLRQYLNRQGALTGSTLVDAVSQVASGIAYLHSHGIIHRDLKPQNILVSYSNSSTRSSSGLSIKIGDFGLARTYTPKLGKYTKEVMTLWYRCPELLLGGPIYGPAGDCWGLGCLIGEMGSGIAMFSGESEVAVMFKIFKTLGTPSDDEWPGVEGLVHFSKKFPQWTVSENELVENLYCMLSSASRRTPRDQIRFSLNQVSSSSPCSVEMKLVDIMRGLFSYIPSRRLTATEVVKRLDNNARDS